MQIKVTKNLAGLGMGLGLSILLVGSSVLAVEGSPLVTPTDPEQSTTMTQRIAQRQSALKLKLTATQQQSLKAKCTAAQIKLQALKTRDAEAASKRQQVYSDLASKLVEIIAQLKLQGIDTTQITAAQESFNAAVNDYLSDAVAYKTALDDAAAIECSADPTGFEASLLSARQLRTQLTADVAKIKAARPQLIKTLNFAKQSLNSSSEQKVGQ